MNLFYPRSMISLLIMISFIEKKKIKNKKNYLILERVYFDNFVKTINNINFLYKYFKIIKIISTPETKHKIFRLNYLKLYFYSNHIINKISNLKSVKDILNVEYKNVYGAGSFLDEVFYKTNKKAKFYFVEHGLGNIYNFTNQNFLKIKINFIIKYILNYIFKNTNTKYHGYLGILNYNFKEDIYINNYKIRENIKIDIEEFKKTLNVFSRYLKKNYKTKYNPKQNLILLNWNFLIKPKEKELINILIDNKVDRKKDTLIIKLHNKSMNNKSSNYRFLIRILKKNKFKLKIINNNMSFLPLEFIVQKLKIKKMISLMSSTTFYVSIMYPDVVNILYFSYNKKFKEYYSPEHKTDALYLYKKKFKNIVFN